MPRKSQPTSNGQASKQKREQRRFWHSLALAIGEGVITGAELDEKVAR